MSQPIKRIAVMTSGGDAPGMNAAIRAVVRAGIANNLEVYGIRRAFAGLVQGDFTLMDSRSVGGIIQRGGTILQTARFPEFSEDRHQRKAIRNLSERGIDGLVVVGGDGSLTGARTLHRRGVRVVGVPGSIDNDIWGTDSCIGVDTALNTILDAIDRLRDTASSHQRVFVVEVMGRRCGHLAMAAGLVSGAEVVLIPEHEITLAELDNDIEQAYLHGKAHGMIVVAEGANLKAQEIVDHLTHSDIGFETRMIILGHVQRGGNPTAFDRLLATRFGVAAVRALLDGKSGVMTALQDTRMMLRELEEVIGKQRPINPDFVELGELLA
jgi:6-phosphofructokinase 1